MKRTLVAMTLVGALALPAEGQFVVEDPLNLAQNIIQTGEQLLQTVYQYEQLETLYQQLRNLNFDDFRDVLLVVDGARELVQFGEAIGFAEPGAFERFQEYFPTGFVLTAELLELEGLSVQTVERLMVNIRRDSAAGVFGATATHDADITEVQSRLTHLRARAKAAEGSGQALHVSNELGVLTSEELVKLNQQLSGLIQLSSTQMAEQASRESLAYETGYAAIVEGDEDTRGYSDFGIWQ